HGCQEIKKTVQIGIALTKGHARFFRPQSKALLTFEVLEVYPELSVRSLSIIFLSKALTPIAER
ncbi:MAG: hypothetical protein D6816_07745, partial [Bacteroidetes bacterium]